MPPVVLATRRLVNSHSALIWAVSGFALLLVFALESGDAIEATLSGRVGGMSALRAAVLATLCTAAATGAGALPLLFTGNISARTQTTMLGFSAGVMLAASIFSLLLPSIGAATEIVGSKAGGGLLAGAALLLGASLLLLMDKVVPHEHPVQGAHGRQYAAIRRVWLFVFAITLHNVPEGLAVGVAFGAGDLGAGLPLAVGIGVQNMPEGLAVALAMLTLNYTRTQAVLIALATGLVEPIGGLIGAGAIAISGSFLPWGLGFAAGAMLFVISHEIIPESHRNGKETSATVGLFAGFVLMMLFDTTLT
jgi:ZIP family zinc transporter